MTVENSNKPFNVWDHKPWWCQPWSIILTGMTVVSGSWLMLHRLWLSFLVGIPIAVWWAYFLVLYPRAVAKMYESEANSQ